MSLGAKAKEETYTIDASGKILGRLAVEIVNILRGKNKPNFLPYLEGANGVVVFNADKMKVSGKKMKQKIYYRHSLYPGGLKKKVLREMFEKDSREVLRRAVYGMLPKNKLRAKMIKRLKMYKGEIK